MKRRQFITTAGAATAAAGAGVFSILKHPRDAQAAAWGAWPADKMEAIIPPELQAQRVLELHFLGGITPWETFYTVPSFGESNGNFLQLFDGDPINAPDAYAQCGYGAQPYTEPFAEDANGEMVHFGPWTAPLRARPDIMARTRVMVQFHTNLAHEGANPIAFTGRALGNPSLAGIGAHIQRYFIGQPGGERAVPYSYLLFPSGPGFSAAFAQSAVALGFHPGAARPMSLQVQPNSDLALLLERPSVPPDRRAAFDETVDYYAQAYGNRLRPQGVGPIARSSERGNFNFAHYSRTNAEELTQILTNELFAAQAGTACEGSADFDTSNGSDMPRMQAEIARQLLTHPEAAARYVQWLDVGIRPRPEVGHDVHQSHIEYSAINIPHTLEQLASIIATPEQDAEALGLLDLDDTLIVVNMEFGRTHIRQGAGDGTNHWPRGYVNLMIGGPVSASDSRSPGASIYGSISGADGPTAATAEEFCRPSENRMMVLAALGIYPFSSQSFAVSDVANPSDPPTELDAATQLRDRLWGLDV